jgi:hypothetical protein
MHRAVGAALIAVGALCAALGLLIMAVLGPDGRLTTGPHRLDTDGIAAVTAPKLIRWKNLQVEVLAELPANKPVFVGLGNSVDVQSYLDGVSRLEVTQFTTPWKVRTREISGKARLPGAPTALDWWTKQSAGLGGAWINATLPDETVSVAVLAIGDTNLRGLKVTLAYGLKGAFLKGVGLLLGGLGLAWAGLLARRGATLWKTDDTADQPESPRGAGDPDEVEEVVYVWVDEDGVEHELSAEEAAEHEVVDESALPDPVADTADDPGAAPAAVEPVKYFWVDDDGVEHEVSAEELHEFEVLDEEDKP